MRTSLLVLVVALSACDREAPRGAPVADSAVTTAVIDAAVDAAKPPEPERAGSVTITQTKGSGTSLGAYFMETVGQGLDCKTGVVVGACTPRVCTRSMTPTTTTRKTAGDILVSVGQFPSTIAPTKDGTTFWYAPRPLAVVKDGQVVEFKAAGGEAIPAFQGTVTAPAWITLKAPVIPAAPKFLDIKQTGDLEFAWTPATNGVFHVMLARPEREKQTSIECTVDATAKKLTIDKSLLAAVPLGHVVFTIDLTAKSEVKAGNFPVTLGVSDSILSAGAEIVP